MKDGARYEWRVVATNSDSDQGAAGDRLTKFRTKPAS